MPIREMEIGPTGQRVATNVAALRTERGQSKTEMGRLLDELGRPMTLDVLTKLEDQRRRVDTDDLLALALALRCSPNRLLLPAYAGGDATVALTSAAAPAAHRAWMWAAGEAPLGPTGEGLLPWSEYVSFPHENRPHRDHSPVNRAHDCVLDPIREAVDRAIEAGVSPVAALDCAESAVRLRGITSSTRNYMLFSRELIDVAPDYSQRVQSESGGYGD
jgi:hypothetical protein